MGLVKGLSSLTQSENTESVMKIARLKDLDYSATKQDVEPPGTTCADLIQSTNREIKQIMNKISRIIGDGFYSELHPDHWIEIEMLDSVANYFKISLRGQLPPLQMHVRYHSTRDLVVYLAVNQKEPNE